MEVSLPRGCTCFSQQLRFVSRLLSCRNKGLHISALRNERERGEEESESRTNPRKIGDDLRRKLRTLRTSLDFSSFSLMQWQHSSRTGFDVSSGRHLDLCVLARACPPCCRPQFSFFHLWIFVMPETVLGLSLRHSNPQEHGCPRCGSFSSARP